MTKKFNEKQYEENMKQEVDALTFLRISTKVATVILNPNIVNVSHIYRHVPKDDDSSSLEYTAIEIIRGVDGEVNINGNIIAPWDYRVGNIHVYGDEILFLSPSEDDSCQDVLFYYNLKEGQVVLVDLENDENAYTIVVNTMDKESVEVLLK